MEIKNQFDNLLNSIKNIQKNTDQKLKELPSTSTVNVNTNIPKR